MVPAGEPVRTIGRAVTGGYVYRGAQLPAAYRGRYFVADSSTSVVGSIGISVNPLTREGTFTGVVEHTAEIGGSLGGVVSFGRDRDGEIYLVTFAGRVLKIVSADAPAAPTGLQFSVAGRTVLLRWTPPATGGAPTGYRLEAGSTSGAANLAVFPTGAAPGLDVTAVPDGVYFVRVRAERNGLLGPPSNEVQVVVNGCPVPGAPASFGATVNGTDVTLAAAGDPLPHQPLLVG